MPVAAIDTHEVVTRVVRRSQDIDLSKLATKTDLAALRSDLHAVMSDTKADILKWVVGMIGAVIALVRLVSY